MGAEGRRIDIGGGYHALVDAEDFDDLNRIVWHAKRKIEGSSVYTQHNVRGVGGRGAPRFAVMLHRLVMLAPKGVWVDHINGDTLDNRRCNLRFCTPAQNSQNVRSSKKQKRGEFKGVHWHKRGKKWEAYICPGKEKSGKKSKRVYLGLFADPIEAARAYDRAALKFFGEFAALNFPDDRVASRVERAARVLGGAS